MGCRVYTKPGQNSPGHNLLHKIPPDSIRLGQNLPGQNPPIALSFAKDRINGANELSVRNVPNNNALSYGGILSYVCRFESGILSGVFCSFR